MKNIKLEGSKKKDQELNSLRAKMFILYLFTNVQQCKQLQCIVNFSNTSFWI